MEEANLLQKNAERFTGFADIYDQARPTVPRQPVELIIRYFGRKPELVVDLGSGTGLSALAWEGNCGKLIGIEPSPDMLRVARKKESDTLSFRRAFGNDTGLPDACADAAVCSQSFHWMEPVSTLNEVDRILRPDGVFATIDCDWPPVTRWEAELAYQTLYAKVKRLESELPDVKESFVRYPKERHLANIRDSGHFRYCRELLFSNTESCTAERFCSLILSQGSLQTVQKLHPHLLSDDIARFQSQIEELFGADTFPVEFCYRMRIGIK